MRSAKTMLVPVIRSLWVLYLGGALYWLCGLDVTAWRFWAVSVPVALLQPLSAFLGDAYWSHLVLRNCRRVR